MMTSADRHGILKTTYDAYLTFLFHCPQTSITDVGRRVARETDEGDPVQANQLAGSSSGTCAHALGLSLS